MYQGANPDVGSSISIPKGAKVTDVSMTLSGASSTGWSDIVDNNRDDWIEGEISSTDSRSDDLTLAMANMTVDFFPHGIQQSKTPHQLLGWITGPMQSDNRIHQTLPKTDSANSC